MFSSIGKSSTFLLLLSLWAICPLTVSAQNQFGNSIQVVEGDKLASVGNIPPPSPSDATAALPNTFQTRDTQNFTEPKIDWNRDFRVKANHPAASPRPENLFPEPKKNRLDDDDDVMPAASEKFRWGSAIRQSLLLLGVQHGYAFTQLKTRSALKGKFLKDYAASVKSLHGWADGGRFFTNYVAHPMQGSVTGLIYIQNDPRGLKQQFGSSGDYWRSRLKAMAWTAAWSTQFEIGPISQASIGNVGLKGKQTYIDIVITPIGGTAMLISEDAIDRFVMERIERRTDNFYVIIFSRMLLSPTRTIANLFRFKTPWHRDRSREH